MQNHVCRKVILMCLIPILVEVINHMMALSGALSCGHSLKLFKKKVAFIS